MYNNRYVNELMSPMGRREATMTFLKKFSIQTEDDEDDNCDVKNVIVLDIGVIIIADVKNAIKAFNMEGKYLDSVTPNNMRCFGLTVTGHNGFAATLNSTVNAGREETKLKKIGFYELVAPKSDQQQKMVLKEIQTVDTHSRYMAIAVLPNKKLIGGTKGAVNLMTSEGDAIGPMTSEIEFRTPYHVRVTESGKIVIADSEKISISVFDRKGRVEKQLHVGRFGLRGIASTNDVILFVHRKDDFVSMISPDEEILTHIRANEEKLNDPQAVFLLQDGRLVIAELGVVKIFRIDDYEKISKEPSHVSVMSWRGTLGAIALAGFLLYGGIHVLRNARGSGRV
ncbi:uncharacterized protein LOC121386868 [Gigantopelta aegis]|uniref:uncharacterized protein LOC121386868 n=1 Tax=Gigantopelta aegis TaxID=1735272 RepID=UPI001B88B8EE|nr:uncharacterized protein LOC121386868 [Gigantopelta aegis]